MNVGLILSAPDISGIFEGLGWIFVLLFSVILIPILINIVVAAIIKVGLQKIRNEKRKGKMMVMSNFSLLGFLMIDEMALYLRIWLPVIVSLIIYCILLCCFSVLGYFLIPLEVQRLAEDGDY